MDNIVKFPSKMVHDKNLFEKTIRNCLSTADLDSESINAIIERLHPIWQKYQHEFQIADLASMDKKTFETALENFQTQLHDFHNNLLLERINTEIKIYLMEHGL